MIRLFALVSLLAATAGAQTPPPDSLAARWGRAIEADDAGAVDALLAWGVTPEVPGDPPIYLAARQGRTALVRRLLGAGADPDTRSVIRGETTPLHAAVYQSHIETAAVLLNAGADPLYRSRIGFAAFDWALERGDLATMSWLVDHLRASASGDEAGSYALVLAVFADAADELDAHLDAGADPRASNAVRYPPLTLAARLDRPDMVRRLIEAGADPNSGRVELDEASPLHQAARGGSLEPARLLLAAGADPNKLNARGFTALHLAALYDRPAVAAALLAAGTDPAVRSVDALPEIGEYTAFDFAVEQGRLAVADTLLAWAARHAADAGPDRLAQAALRGDLDGASLSDPDAPSTPGATPLALAARFGHVGAVRELLAAGASPGRRSVDRYQATPLMQAVAGGHAEVVDVLLASGAKVDARDRYGRTALAWAAASGRGALAERLLAAGADRTVRGLGRQTAADVARTRGDTSLATLLDE